MQARGAYGRTGRNRIHLDAVRKVLVAAPRIAYEVQVRQRQKRIGRLDVQMLEKQLAVAYGELLHRHVPDFESAALGENEAVYTHDYVASAYRKAVQIGRKTPKLHVGVIHAALVRTRSQTHRKIHVGGLDSVYAQMEAAVALRSVATYLGDNLLDVHLSAAPLPQMESAAIKSGRSEHQSFAGKAQIQHRCIQIFYVQERIARKILDIKILQDDPIDQLHIHTPDFDSRSEKFGSLSGRSPRRIILHRRHRQQQRKPERQNNRQ